MPRPPVAGGIRWRTQPLHSLASDFRPDVSQGRCFGRNTNAMTRDPNQRREPGRIRAARRVAVLASALVTLGSGTTRGQSPPNSPVGALPAAAATALIPPDVQIVRFQGPEGLRVDVLGPNPEPVPIGNGKGLATVGLKIGVSYHLKLSHLPERPGVEVFPVIEVVGHLHRPAAVDPGKYPVRVVFTEDDLDDVVDRGRLVTQVIYLEDPEQALPIALPKEQIAVVGLSPAENPLKVATALGRVMAIVRIGNRRPTPEEADNGALGPPSVPGAMAHVLLHRPIAASVRWSAGRRAARRRRRVGRGCRRTNTSATAATITKPPISPVTAALPASTRATP